MHFFWPSLRCKVIEQMVKSRYLVDFPAQKKEPKWFQNLGRFKKNSSCSVAKKSPKNWTGPCLSLNMVRRKRFIKWQTPSRNAKSSFQGANPTPPSPMQQWRPPARTTIVSRTVGQHLFDTMCPTAFLAPTLTTKTCLSALSHKMHFFWPSLRCKVIEQMVKSRYLVEFPAQKKEPKWFQNLGRFKKNSSCSVAKKSPKNWTGPCLSLNMVRRKRFIKWQTPSRNAKSSFQGANPTPPSPMQQWRPPARTTIVSRTVGQHLFDTMCPTAFLAPTLTTKTCLSALSHKMHFFWPSLRCKVIEQMVKSRYLVEFPAPKKGTKMVPKSGSFQEEFFLLSGQKKSQKLDRALP